MRTVTLTDEEVYEIRLALNMHRNVIETGNPVLSARLLISQNANYTSRLSATINLTKSRKYV